jgi:metal-responsive CopG/Arc/MetJ family transcriptional regulator
MHTLEQLEKLQVGLRLPRYLLEEIDSFTREFAVNRTDIITEALRAYLSEQKAKLLYNSMATSAQEAKKMMDGTLRSGTLKDLIDELDHSADA